MEDNKKGVFVVISGLSGSGKNFFQDIILESSDAFQRVPKYTTRGRRCGEETSVDQFNVDNNIIQSCTWKYIMNGNSYGIKAEDVKRIIQTR